MSIKINILNASEEFNHVFGMLEAKAEHSVYEIGKYIELPKLDIVIHPTSEEYKTDRGIMGCVTTPHLIEILLDTDRDDLESIINNELTASIAHELHHVVRQCSGVEENSLFQILITEGLACHFETKFSRNVTPIFLEQMKKYEWRDLFSKMQTNLQDTNIDYPIYFGGKDLAKFPKRAGYWVGFNLVSQYIDEHGGCASTLVDVPAEKFVVA